MTTTSVPNKSLYDANPDAFADWLGKVWGFWFSVLIALVGGISYGLSLVVQHGSKLALIVAIVLWASSFVSQTVIQLLALFSLQAQQVKAAAEASVERAANHAEMKALLATVSRIEKDEDVLLTKIDTKETQILVEVQDPN